ncbi:MAG: hypothetical protein ACK4S8_14820 [Alishewanella aestuarii]
MTIALDVIGSILGEYKSRHGLRIAPLGHIPTNEQIPIRTRHLHELVVQRGHVDIIRLYEVDHPAQHIIAQVQKFTETTAMYGSNEVAHIYFASNQNLCWRRFAVCKEMYHCMIDRLPHQRVATLKDLQHLMNLLAVNTTSITGTFPPYTNEQVAEIYALETLFPVEFRLAHEDDYTQGTLSSHDLAMMYRVPESYVQLAFSPVYFETVKLLRGRLFTLDQ